MESSINPKLICIMIIVSAICIAVFIVIIAFYTSSDYIKIKATVVDIDYKTDDGVQNDSKTSKNYYIVFKYQVDGSEYVNKCRTFFPFLYKKGGDINIYYDPQDCITIKNHFVIEICVAGIVFLMTFFGGILVVYLKQRVRK